MALVIGAGAAAVLASPGGRSAAAQAVAARPVDVVEVSGRIDAVEAGFIRRSVASAARQGSQMLVIQLDSPGAVLPGREMDELTERVRRSAVPVAVWVGPSGSRAGGAALRLVEAASTAGMATGTHLRPASGARLSADEALRLGLVDTVTPTLGDFIVAQDGRELAGRVLATARQVDVGGQPRREPIAQVRFAKLNLAERVVHIATNPSIAYLLLTAGLLLVLFEYYSCGVGLAGLTGAVSFVMASYGLAALDASPVGLGLLGLATFGFAVDVQVGAPRAWTVIGTVAFVLGSIWLFPPDRRVAWFALLVVLVLTLLFVLRAMPTMVRARFSTSAISRRFLVGEAGVAAGAVGTAGTVRLRDGLWPARVKRGGPIGSGDPVKAVAIDGLVVEVEPARGEPQAVPPAGM